MPATTAAASAAAIQKLTRRNVSYSIPRAVSNVMPVTWPRPGAINTSIATTSANTQVLMEKYASRSRNSKSALIAPTAPQKIAAAGSAQEGDTPSLLATKIVV